MAKVASPISNTPTLHAVGTRGIDHSTSSMTGPTPASGTSWNNGTSTVAKKKVGFTDDDPLRSESPEDNIAQLKEKAPGSPEIEKPGTPKIVFTSTNGLKELPKQVSKASVRKGVDFTIMVVGEKGSGKSTFINTLFDQNISSRTQKTISDDLKTTHIHVDSAICEENGFQGRFTIVTTSGFGDYSSNDLAWIPITNYIEGQHRSYMYQEEQPDRKKLTDTRVHVCLYFLQPTGHELLPLDIKTMYEISLRANLIPVIAKADSLTRDELERFKNLIRMELAAKKIKVFEPKDVQSQVYSCTNQDNSTISSSKDEYDKFVSLSSDRIPSSASLSVDLISKPASSHTTNNSDILVPKSESSEGLHTSIGWPYAVVSSYQRTTSPTEAKIRCRSYRWGLVEIENDNHSDFKELRNVLMADHMLDLISSTHETFYSGRRQQLMQQRFLLAQQLSSQEELGKTNRRTTCRSTPTTHCGSASEDRDQSRIPSGISHTALTQPTQGPLTNLGRGRSSSVSAEGLSSLEKLSLIKHLGGEYLDIKSIEEDQMYIQRVNAIQEDFSVVAGFQEERFRAWYEQLEQLKTTYEAEIVNLQRQNETLSEKVSELESKVKPSRGIKIFS